MIPRLKKCYIKEIVPKFMQIPEFNYKNKHQVPCIKKIVINRGLGDASQNEQILKSSPKFRLSFDFNNKYQKTSNNNRLNWQNLEGFNIISQLGKKCKLN